MLLFLEEDIVVVEPYTIPHPLMTGDAPSELSTGSGSTYLPLTVGQMYPNEKKHGPTVRHTLMPSISRSPPFSPPTIRCQIFSAFMKTVGCACLAQRRAIRVLQSWRCRRPTLLLEYWEIIANCVCIKYFLVRDKLLHALSTPVISGIPVCHTTLFAILNHLLYYTAVVT